jgi:hypothetical protein
LVLLSVLALSCSEEGHPESASSTPDQAMVVDMSGASDDMGTDDLSSAVSCGQILTCVAAQCGLTNVTCDQMCVTGAPTTSITQAGALIACAALNCLGGDGGGGGLGGGGLNVGLFLCMQQHCSMQLANCPGLLSGLGGM